MLDWCFRALLLAQEKPEQTVNPFLQMLPMLLMVGAVYYFIILLPQKRDRAKRDEMLGGLKKNDKVVTIGGIIGSVANVSADGKEITLKVDDNTRIKFQRSSIHQVLRDEDKKEATEQAS